MKLIKKKPKNVPRQSTQGARSNHGRAPAGQKKLNIYCLVEEVFG